MCVDLREVNKAVVPDRFPLPTVEELSATFHDAVVFSKLDLTDSYLQLLLEEDSRYLTAFITHDGVFQYRRTCFGLCSAPSAFQKVISTKISGIDGTINFLDDIAVSGASQSIHDTWLQLVLQRLKCHQVTLNREKSMFNQSSIEFLGYRVAKSGVTPILDKVRAIASLSPPQNSSDLASFLAMVNYYAKFIHRYGESTEPLRQLLRKNHGTGLCLAKKPSTF